MPARVSPSTISYVNVPEREIMPMLPSLNTLLGMMPTIDLPGEITPGQLGPMMRMPLVVATTFIISCTGMPSVMHTANSMPASNAS